MPRRPTAPSHCHDRFNLQDVACPEPPLRRTAAAPPPDWWLVPGGRCHRAGSSGAAARAARAGLHHRGGRHRARHQRRSRTAAGRHSARRSSQRPERATARPAARATARGIDRRAGSAGLRARERLQDRGRRPRSRGGQRGCLQQGDAGAVARSRRARRPRLGALQGQPARPDAARESARTRGAVAHQDQRCRHRRLCRCAQERCGAERVQHRADPDSRARGCHRRRTGRTARRG